MRLFEILLLVAVTVLPFVKRPLVRAVRPIYLIAGLGLLLGFHLFLEGWRWQLFPAYLLTLVLAWRIQVVDVSRPARLSLPRVLGYSGLVILLVLSWVLPLVLPVFTLPEPGGPYQVGTKMIHLQTGRAETITPDPSDQRELMLKVWYPSEAAVSSLEAEAYVDKGSRAGFAVKYGLPPGALNYLDRVETHVYPEIPIDEGPFPVLIFSHGYGSKATGYYALLTELASQGYVIVNMNHTYESLGVTFPDGRIRYFDYDYQRKISEGSMEMVGPLIEAFKNGLDYEARHPIVREAVRDYFEGDIQDRWSADMIQVLDLLKEWNSAGVFKGQLDLNRVGVFGHSVGGGAAGRTAMRDERVKAAANLDGIQWGRQIDTMYHIPYLYVSADWPAEHEDINSHIYINKSTDVFYEAKLLRSGHPDFMDIPFMIPVRALAGTGEIDPYQGTEIVTDLLTAFFDRHLKDEQAADPQKVGEESALLEMTVYEGGR